MQKITQVQAQWSRIIRFFNPIILQTDHTQQIRQDHGPHACLYFLLLEKFVPN